MEGNSMDISMTTTTFELDGYRVVKNLGVVRGITVRSRSIFGTIGATLETLVGGNITLFTELCEKTRAEAFEMMVRHSEEVSLARTDPQLPEVRICRIARHHRASLRRIRPVSSPHQRPGG
jgi:hypothetical protein